MFGNQGAHYNANGTHGELARRGSCHAYRCSVTSSFVGQVFVARPARPTRRATLCAGARHASPAPAEGSGRLGPFFDN